MVVDVAPRTRYAMPRPWMVRTHIFELRLTPLTPRQAYPIHGLLSGSFYCVWRSKLKPKKCASIDYRDGALTVQTDLERRALAWVWSVDSSSDRPFHGSTEWFVEEYVSKAKGLL